MTSPGGSEAHEIPADAFRDPEIDIRKFTNYSMMPDRRRDSGERVGKEDAWRKAGHNVDDPTAREAAASEVIAWIRERLKAGEYQIEPPPDPKETEHGRRYTLKFNYVGPNKTEGVLQTGWMVNHGAHRARLTTNWLMIKKKDDHA